MQGQIPRYTHMRLSTNTGLFRISMLSLQVPMRTFFLNEFVKLGLISETMQKNRKIDIRFVFKSIDVVSGYSSTSIG